MGGISALGIAGGTGVASAATLHVDPNGTGYTTIQAAVDGAAPGDTVTVAPDPYHEEVFVWTDDLTIVGDPGSTDEIGPGPDAPSVVGDGRDEAAGFRLTSSSGTTVAGFEVRDFGTESWGTGVKGGRADVTIRDNYLHDLSANGVGRAGSGQVDPTGFVVERNRVEDVGEAGVRLDNGDGSVVRNNEVTVAVRGSGAQVHGVSIHQNARHGESVDGSGIRVEDNDVLLEIADGSTAPFHTAGVWVLVINTNEPPAGTVCRFADLTIAGNRVRRTGGAEDASLEAGVTLAVNPGAGAETRLEDVTVEGNDLQGLGFGVHVGAGDPDGLGRVAVTGNAIRGNRRGVTVGHDVVGDRLQLAANDIAGNARWGLNHVGSSTVDAEQNYWGAPNGPEREAPGRGRQTVGDGDRVYGEADVTPWRPQPHGD